MAEKEAAKELERIYVIPLRKAKHGPSSRAAPRGMKEIRTFIIKHMKAEDDNVWLDKSVNEKIWERGKYKVPSKIRVRATKYEDGVVEVTLPEVSDVRSRRDILREEREIKAASPILKREEMPEEGEEGDGEDYEVVPTGDGEVKIKKKKEKHESDEEEGDEDLEEAVEEPISEEEPSKEPSKEPKEEKPKAKPAEKPKDEKPKAKPAEKKEAPKKEEKEKPSEDKKPKAEAKPKEAKKEEPKPKKDEKASEKPSEKPKEDKKTEKKSSPKKEE